jgi:hypothetical protein
MDGSASARFLQGLERAVGAEAAFGAKGTRGVSLASAGAVSLEAEDALAVAKARTSEHSTADESAHRCSSFCAAFGPRGRPMDDRTRIRADMMHMHHVESLGVALDSCVLPASARREVGRDLAGEPPDSSACGGTTCEARS